METKEFSFFTSMHTCSDCWEAMQYKSIPAVQNTKPFEKIVLWIQVLHVEIVYDGQKLEGEKMLRSIRFKNVKKKLQL